mmetsp:Transcript_9807/g.36934  ORF Transcript_9807/g.36934 Transcript_9807/m.36934 type:complete len:556 (-) Transcript_9807:231-1898(-)
MRALSLFSALIICASWVPCATLVSRVASSKAGRTTGRRALFPRGDHGEEDLVTLTEQHSPELLLKHGALQRHGAGSAESDQMQPLTLALRGQTGDLIAAASTEKLQEAKVLCTLPKRLRSKPLKALAVAHSLIYSLDLLEHLAEVTRQAGVDMLGDRATLGEVVVVGFTALSRCLIPVLSELGFEVNVVVPSESDAKVARSLGATATLLRDEEAFSDAFPDAVAYVDAIGRQHTSSLSHQLRGRYFSVVPVRVHEAIRSGAMKGLSLGLGPSIFGFPKHQSDADESRTIWTPRPETAGRMSQALDALSRAPGGELHRMMYHIHPEVASWKDYGQVLTWPRDPASGLPFGFAASVSEALKVSEGWGVEDSEDEEHGHAVHHPAHLTEPRHIQLLNEVANHLLEAHREEQEEERLLQQQIEEEVLGGATAVAEATGTLATASPTEVLSRTGVQRLETIEDALRVIHSKNSVSVLLIGGQWCRACKYASAQVRRVAMKFPDVEFFEYRASHRGEPLKSSFGIAAVPTLLLNRNGATIHHASSCSDSKLIAADVESWLL